MQLINLGDKRGGNPVEVRDFITGNASFEL
jgi:hypothetical protein